jgi:hypothetical protein
MRTTLSIDDDVLLAVKEMARKQRRSAGSVLSEVARAGLHSRGTSQPKKSSESFFGFQPLPHRGPPVANELINKLREDENA